MMIPWRIRLYDRRDRFFDAVTRFWLCDIHNQHHVKMDSYPRCYRCERWVISG